MTHPTDEKWIETYMRWHKATREEAEQWLKELRSQWRRIWKPNPEGNAKL